MIPLVNKFSVLFSSGYGFLLEHKLAASKHQDSKYPKIKSKALRMKDASTSSVRKGLLHPRRAWFPNLALFSLNSQCSCARNFADSFVIWKSVPLFCLQDPTISGHVINLLLWKAIRQNCTVACLRHSLAMFMMLVLWTRLLDLGS